MGPSGLPSWACQHHLRGLRRLSLLGGDHIKDGFGTRLPGHQNTTWGMRAFVRLQLLFDRMLLGPFLRCPPKKGLRLVLFVGPWRRFCFSVLSPRAAIDRWNFRLLEQQLQFGGAQGLEGDHGTPPKAIHQDAFADIRKRKGRQRNLKRWPTSQKFFNSETFPLLAFDSCLLFVPSKSFLEQLFLSGRLH